MSAQNVQDAQAQPVRGARNRKVSPALLVLLGVAAVGAVVYLVVSLGGGGRKQAGSAPSPAASSPARAGGAAPGAAPTGASGASPSVSASPTAGASPSPSASPTAGTPAFELSEARDPFRPLVVPPAEGGGSAGGGSPAPSPVASAGPGAAGAPAPAGGQEVELLDIVDDAGTAKAQVRVGTTVSTAAVGDTFASTYKLLSIEGTCATMLNGEDKFTLCKGDQVLK
jgi:hypothetical protein